MFLPNNKSRLGQELSKHRAEISHTQAHSVPAQSRNRQEDEAGSILSKTAHASSATDYPQRDTSSPRRILASTTFILSINHYLCCQISQRVCRRKVGILHADSVMRPCEHEQLRAVADRFPVKYHVSGGVGKRIIKIGSSRIRFVMPVQNRLVTLFGQHDEADHVVKGVVSTNTTGI